MILKKSPLFLLLSVLSFTGDLTADTLDDLRAERRELNRALRKAVPDVTKIDPALTDLQRASLDAQKALLKALEAHPELAAVNAEIRKVDEDMIQAITAKDESAKAALQEKSAELRRKRDEEAAKIPELVQLTEANQQAGAAYFQREKEALLAHPEAGPLKKRLEEISAEIQAEMRK